MMILRLTMIRLLALIRIWFLLLTVVTEIKTRAVVIVSRHGRSVKKLKMTAVVLYKINTHLSIHIAVTK